MLFVTYQHYGCWSDSVENFRELAEILKGVDHRKGCCVRKRGCKVVPSYIGKVKNQCQLLLVCLIEGKSGKNVTLKIMHT